MAATANRNAGATGFGNHGKRIVRTPNIAVAEHWNVKRFDQLANPAPVGVPAVIFGGGTRVQGHRLAAFLLRDMARFQERFMLMVDADADFSRHRHVGSIADLDHTLDDLAKQIRLPRQSRSAAASGHFRHGASEVQIDMVGHVFVDDDFRGLFHDRRVHTVQLQRTDFLARREMAQPQRFGIACDQRARGDHFGHV